MDIINLGATDGLPRWTERTLSRSSMPDHRRRPTHTTSYDVALDVNEDGTPHVTAVGGFWLDGSFWFRTGSGPRKGRNVARDPRCSIAVSIRDADVVAEGEAARETNPATLTRLAKGLGGPGVARRTG